MKRIVGYAHFVGPLLLLVAIAVFEMGIGLNSDGFSSHTEGIIGFYALMGFVLIYINSAEMIARDRPVYGGIVYILGLIGACAGVMAMGYRVIAGALDKSGMTEEIMANFLQERMSGEMMAMAPAALCFPLTSVLIGIGFIVIKPLSVQRWVGPVLIIAGIAFLIAEGSETIWGLTYFYPIAGICWFLGFGSVGRQLLKA